MDTIYWHMNTTQGGANLHPGVNLYPGANLHPGAKCAHEHGLSRLVLHPNYVIWFNQVCKFRQTQFSVYAQKLHVKFCGFCFVEVSLPLGAWDGLCILLWHSLGLPLIIFLLFINQNFPAALIVRHSRFNNSKLWLNGNVRKKFVHILTMLTNKKFFVRKIFH